MAAEEATGIRVGPTVAVAVGTVIFALLVWIAFLVSFDRVRPDLAISSLVSLDGAPVVEFDPEPQGWELVVPGDTATGMGPQYANAVQRDEPVCVISWQAGSLGAQAVDLSGIETDLDGTRAVLTAAGMNAEGTHMVQVSTDTGETLEMLYVPQQRADGLDAATAARVFVGSNHYLTFSLVCDSGGQVSTERMLTVLADAVVSLRLPD